MDACRGWFQSLDDALAPSSGEEPDHHRRRRKDETATGGGQNNLIPNCLRNRAVSVCSDQTAAPPNTRRLAGEWIIAVN